MVIIHIPVPHYSLPPFSCKLRIIRPEASNPIYTRSFASPSGTYSVVLNGWNQRVYYFLHPIFSLLNSQTWDVWRMPSPSSAIISNQREFDVRTLGPRKHCYNISSLQEQIALGKALYQNWISYCFTFFGDSLSVFHRFTFVVYRSSQWESNRNPVCCVERTDLIPCSPKIRFYGSRMEGKTNELLGIKADCFVSVSRLLRFTGKRLLEKGSTAFFSFQDFLLAWILLIPDSIKKERKFHASWWGESEYNRFRHKESKAKRRIRNAV